MVPSLLGIYICLVRQYLENRVARPTLQVLRSVPRGIEDGDYTTEVVGRVLMLVHPPIQMNPKVIKLCRVPQTYL